jgi:Uma2 family endonuclease
MIALTDESYISPEQYRELELTSPVKHRRAESLQEYVLISQDRMNVEVYRRKDAGRWELQAYEMGDDVEFVSVGVICAIGDLYEDVVLPPEEPEPEE